MLRIENAVQLTRGELKTHVDISYFERLQPFAKKVKMGDLYLAFNLDDIQEAVQNGAHGILYDADVVPFGQGLAWIYVRDIKKAAFDLLKYELLRLKCEYIVCEWLVFDIAKELIQDSSIFFLHPDNPIELFEAIRDNNITAIISFDEHILQYLSSDEQKLFHTPRKHNFELKKATLLCTEIIFNGILSIPYPEVMLRYLSGAILLAKELGLDIQQINLKPSICFEPYFVVDGIYEAEYGKTTQVVIFSNNTPNSLIKDIIDFIDKKLTWGEKLYTMPISKNNLVATDKLVINYCKPNELRDVLEDGTFCYALVVDATKQDILLQKKFTQPLLF